MIDLLLKTTGICLAASVLAALLRRDSPELGLLLTAGAVLCGSFLLLRAGDSLAGLGEELVELTGLSPTLFTPLLKVTAVSWIVRVGGAVCADAGQSALARTLEIAGAFCALGCAVPLLRSVLELLRGWI